MHFEAGADYDRYVDGKSRAHGTRSLLASRDLALPEGQPDDAAGTGTVFGLGNAKNEIVQRRIREDGVEVFEGSARFVHAVRRGGLRCAVVSSSANCQAVLAAANIEDLFGRLIDGLTARRENLLGKPAPDIYLAAARALGMKPGECAVFGDSLAGGGRPGRWLRSGHRGGPGWAGSGLSGPRRRHRRVRHDGRSGPVMIGHPDFVTEPWCLRETGLDLGLLAQTESVFALSNGHIG
ncbi:HAD family hydrolase [Pseudarthrobacter sp. S3]|uniref:HAD family hydrolase n=1 Tax=Pseudarthrobacter sp. S3 TaxID=3418419 RepID=UPI003CE8BFEF